MREPAPAVLPSVVVNFSFYKRSQQPTILMIVAYKNLSRVKKKTKNITRDSDAFVFYVISRPSVFVLKLFFIFFFFWTQPFLTYLQRSSVFFFIVYKTKLQNWWMYRIYVGMLQRNINKRDNLCRIIYVMPRTEQYNKYHLYKLKRKFLLGSKFKIFFIKFVFGQLKMQTLSPPLSFYLPIRYLYY